MQETRPITMEKEEARRQGELKREYFIKNPGADLNGDMDKRLGELNRTKGHTLVRRVKVGRNDPCPCGSGRKFKKCCHP